MPERTFTENDELAIRECCDLYVETLTAHDAEGWMDVWDDEAVLMPPDAPQCVGKDEIRRAMHASVAAKAEEVYMTYRLDEIIGMDGGLAVARGSHIWKSLKTPDRKFEGKFLAVLRKQTDGSWKLYRDCYNANGAKQALG